MSQTEVQLIKNNAVVEADIANDAVTRDKINVVSTSSAPGIEIKGDDAKDLPEITPSILVSFKDFIFLKSL